MRRTIGARHQNGDHRGCVGPCRLWATLLRVPDVRALMELARDTDCRDWPALYELAVEVAGPLARSRRPELRSFEAFDMLHDKLWARCRRCHRAECRRCFPLANRGQRRAVA